MDALAVGMLALLAFSIPLENVYVVGSMGTIARVLGALAFGAGLVRVAARGVLRKPRAFHVFAILFIVWATASAFWAHDADAARSRIGTFAQLLILVALLWDVSSTSATRRKLESAFVLGTAVTSVTLISLSLAGVLQVERYTMVGFNPNYMGAVLAVSIPIAWHLANEVRSRTVRILLAGHVCTAVWAVVLTGSRGALIAVVVGVMVIPLTMHRLRLGTTAILMMVALGTLAVGIRSIPSQPVRRLATIRAEIESGSLNRRGAIWSDAKTRALDHPIMGVGAGNFSSDVHGGVRNSAHNSFIAVYLELGLIGFLLFLLLIWSAARAAWRRPRQRMFGIAILGTLLIAMVPLDAEYLKWTWFTLGLVVAWGYESPVCVADSLGKGMA